MYSKHTRRVVGFMVALGLSIAAASSAAAAAGPAAPPVTIPAALEGMQYPGSALSLPDWGDDPVVQAKGQIAIPDWLTRVQYPGTSSYPTVVLTPTASSTGNSFDWSSAGIGAAFMVGVGLLGAGTGLVVRRHRSLAHV